MDIKKFLPRPDLPTMRRSLNLATWLFITAVEFRNSPQQFSSLPTLRVTRVPSCTSPKYMTLKATGRVLFDLQCEGKAEHRILGEPVFINSPGCSAKISVTQNLARKKNSKTALNIKSKFSCNQVFTTQFHEFMKVKKMLQQLIRIENVVSVNKTFVIMKILLRYHKVHIKTSFIRVYFDLIFNTYSQIFFSKLQVTEILAEQASINKGQVTWFPLFSLAHTHRRSNSVWPFSHSLS